MRRWGWFDVWWTLLLISLTGCDWCKHDPLRPDVCFASPFEYQATTYPYEEHPGDPMCDDPEYERNEDMPQAAAPAMPECSGTRSAHIDGPDDVDVYRTGTCSGQIYTNLPSAVTVDAEVKKGADDNLRFCIFPLCVDGATSLQSCTGNSDMRGDTPIVWAASVDSGFIGCCRVGPGSLEAAFFCPGRSRTVDTYFWVDAGELQLSNTCSAYTFDYSVNVD